MFVIYEGGGEVLVTTVENEPEVLKEWFDEGGRDVDDYYRIVSEEKAIRITSRLQLRY